MDQNSLPFRLTICVILLLSLDVMGQEKNDETQKKIKHQVEMILEWAKTKEEKYNEKVDQESKLLNPQDNDTSIVIAAKKIAKEKLFPQIQEKRTEPKQSYWYIYTRRLRDYAASWVPQSVKDRINSWQWQNKTATK